MSVFSPFGSNRGLPIALPFPEGKMHIHGNQMNPNPVNPYSAAAEKAIAAQRSSIARKKQLKRPPEVENPPSSDEAFMVGRWMASRYS
jgi:hypothetical protein